MPRHTSASSRQLYTAAATTTQKQVTMLSPAMRCCAGYAKYIDVPSFIDYLLLTELTNVLTFYV